MPVYDAAKGKRMAVVGQAANDTLSMTGNYDGALCPGAVSHIHKTVGAGCFPSIGQAVSPTVFPANNLSFHL